MLGRIRPYIPPEFLSPVCHHFQKFVHPFFARLSHRFSPGLSHRVTTRFVTPFVPWFVTGFVTNLSPCFSPVCHLFVTLFVTLFFTLFSLVFHPFVTRLSPPHPTRGRGPQRGTPTNRPTAHPFTSTSPHSPTPSPVRPPILTLRENSAEATFPPKEVPCTTTMPNYYISISELVHPNIMRRSLPRSSF